MILLNIFGFISIIILLTTLVALYFYLTRNFNYWKSRGIPGPKPIVGLGTLWPLFFKPLPDLISENTKKYGKVIGLFMGSRPILAISDPELVKTMVIKDFNVFIDRNDFRNGDTLSERSLINLPAEEWRKMRAIISPTFSSGKMKKMHPIIIDCIKRLEVVLENKINDNTNEIELKKIMGNLTMDVIASCAFGTKIDAYNEEKTSDFVRNARKVFGNNLRVLLFFILSATSSKLTKWTGFTFVSPSVEQFFRSAITSIISKRKAEKGKYNDYLELMIKAMDSTEQNEGHDSEDEKSEEIFVQTSDKENLNFKRSKNNITEVDVLATSFLFFVAGYETTAAVLSHLVYSLAVNENCQQKLYEEICSFNRKFDYESIAKMQYLEACVAETLRKYSPASSIGRMAAQDYTIEKIGLKIPKGMLVNFDVHSMHYNPEYYPQPEVWNPERFMPENRDKLTPYTYMPFGAGPRNCVGMRFALMEAKTAIAYLVNKFEFIKTVNTRIPLKFGNLSILLNTGEVKVGIKTRE